MRLARKPVFLGFEDSLVEEQRAGRKESSSRETMQSGDYGYVGCLGMWRRDMKL